MRLLIRLARDSDRENIASLVALYWELENIPGYDRARLTTLLADFLSKPLRGRCWVAEEGGRLVGYLLAVYLFSLEHGGNMAEIDEFFVLNEKRSLHAGTALLDTASEAMTKDGITHLQLQLSTQNLNAKRFYERHGFRSIAGRDVLSKALPTSA
ncbi:MAG: GNAT family N-acetyltransferase [Terriglobia bacterium]|nr:GNAT family N-acetyltransferase [Terriglobia bacterium]